MRASLIKSCQCFVRRPLQLETSPQLQRRPPQLVSPLLPPPFCSLSLSDMLPRINFIRISIWVCWIEWRIIIRISIWVCWIEWPRRISGMRLVLVGILPSSMLNSITPNSIRNSIRDSVLDEIPFFQIFMSDYGCRVSIPDYYPNKRRPLMSALEMEHCASVLTKILNLQDSKNLGSKLSSLSLNEILPTPSTPTSSLLKKRHGDSMSPFSIAFRTSKFCPTVALAILRHPLFLCESQCDGKNLTWVLEGSIMGVQRS